MRRTENGKYHPTHDKRWRQHILKHKKSQIKKCWHLHKKKFETRRYKKNVSIIMNKGRAKKEIIEWKNISMQSEGGKKEKNDRK